MEKADLKAMFGQTENLLEASEEVRARVKYLTGMWRRWHQRFLIYERDVFAYMKEIIMGGELPNDIKFIGWLRENGKLQYKHAER